MRKYKKDERISPQSRRAVGTINSVGGAIRELKSARASRSPLSIRMSIFALGALNLAFTVASVSENQSGRLFLISGMIGLTTLGIYGLSNQLADPLDSTFLSHSIRAATRKMMARQRELLSQPCALARPTPTGGKPFLNMEWQPLVLEVAK